MSEEERKRAELEGNEEFMKYVKLYRVVKIPLIQLKHKMKAEGKFQPILLDLFVDSEQEKAASAAYN
jgi:hypothetical protein